MTVKQLIKALEAMPENARVLHLWDGAARTRIEFIWLSKRGDVVTADSCQPCYSDGARPVGAPTQAEFPIWTTPYAP